MICNKEDEDCKLDHFSMCPGAEPLLNFLYNKAIFKNLHKVTFRHG
jgi:hypothetical protein